MSVNNQAQDRYNAPQNRAVDFEEHYLRDLEIDELFWLNNNSADGNRNHAHRKLTDTGECMNLITREVKMFGNIKVFQKD
tara:strand:+ start:227 stop:466 length:240 start_codon:yes stop_codon:yes gene_type:complete